MQKFTVSADFMRQVPEMTGQVFTSNIPNPEAPKKGFLSGLFGGGPKPCDREELFGESAGKVSSNLARAIPGPGMTPMQGLQGKGISTNSEVAKAKMAAMERGQKLNELEDRTEAMANEAKQFSSNAHQLMQKEKNKKFWQL